MKEKYTLEIAGVQLKLTAEDSEAYIRALENKINERINDMVITKKRCNKTEAAIFCALDYLDEKCKAVHSMENLKKQIENYIREAESLKKENAELKKLLEKRN